MDFSRKELKAYSPYVLICKLHLNHKETFKREILRIQRIKKDIDFLLGRDI